MIRRPRTPAHQQSLLYISMALVVAFADFAAAQTVESPFSALEAAVVRNPYPSARTGGSYMHNFYLPLVASTPWRPSFSPDGQWIAFSMAGSIWKVRVDGDVAYELTSGLPTTPLRFGRRTVAGSLTPPTIATCAST